MDGNTYLQQNFSDFQYNPLDTLSNNFNALSIQEGWSAKHKQTTKNFHRAGFYKAAFEAYYPSDGNRLSTWQKLCYDVGIEATPSSINNCKKALNRTHVNLVNLLDHLNNPKIPLKTFKNRNQFNKYTMDGRIFPKKTAKENVFVKALLERLF